MRAPFAAGDHLYRMNYQDFVNRHRESGADITVAALPAEEKQAQAFGLMKIDTSDDEHFENYMRELLLPQHLSDFGWTCFEEESQVDEFQAQLLQLMCDLCTTTTDPDVSTPVLLAETVC